MGSDSDSDGGRTFSPGIVLRIKYAGLLFFGLIATMVIRGALNSVLQKLPLLSAGCMQDGEGRAISELCTSDTVVYRLSFALCTFYFFHFLSVSDLTCCIESRARVTFQKSLFMVKVVAFFGIFLATFWIPNWFFGGYAWVCLLFSALFLLIQVIFLVDFSYHWSDDWSERAESNSKWQWYLFTIAVGSFLGGLAVTIASYVLFVPHSNCNYNAAAISSVLIGAFVFTAISIWIPHGSIVPSGIVFAYCATVMFLTLRTEQSGQCNRLASSVANSGDWKQLILSSLFTGVVLTYGVVSSSGNGRALGIGVDEDGGDEDPDESGHLSEYMFFYFTMMLGSMYLAMLATNWHVSGMGEGAMLKSETIGFWTRSASVWTAMLLYTWTLLAPYYCCSDRDFGYNTDEW